MPKPTVSVSNHQQIRAVTMHPFVSGAKIYTAEQLDSDGHAALLRVRNFAKRVAATRRNMAEEVAHLGATDARPRQNSHKVRLELFRTAFNDPNVPADLRETIGRFLPEINPNAQG